MKKNFSKYLLLCLMLGIASSSPALAAKKTAAKKNVKQAKAAPKDNSADRIFAATSASIVKLETADAQGKALATGSAIVIEPGQLVSNCHFLAGAQTISVQSGEKSYAANLHYSDAERDLCQLTVADLPNPPVKFGSAKKLKVKQPVYAVGVADQPVPGVKAGIVTAIRLLDGSSYIQTNIATPASLSGGGLFDKDAKLIGITLFFLDENDLNFALPVEWIAQIPRRSVGSFKVVYTDPPGSRMRWMNQIIALEQKQDYNEMLKLAQQWTKKEPHEALAWLSEATAYRYTGDKEKAIPAYHQSLRLKPNDSVAWTNLGTTYSDTKQFEKAAQSYQIATRLKSDSAPGWVNLGIAYSQLGQHEKAANAYKEATRLAPDNVDAWYGLGVSLNSLAKTDEAIKAYQETVRLKPDHVDALYNLAVIYQQQKQSDKLKEVYEPLRTLSPEKAKALYPNN